jgi:hypothetical protein
MSKKWKPDIIYPKPGLLCIIMAPAESHLNGPLRKKLEAEFGPVEYESSVITDDAGSRGLGHISYTPALPGAFPLSDAQNFRIFSFKRPIAREEQVDIKKKVLSIQTHFQENGRLLIDMDTLCLTENSIIRTVLKEKSHTVYLYGGIHAENLYYFEKHSFIPWPHSPYPYRMRNIIQAFNDIRMIYMMDKK